MSRSMGETSIRIDQVYRTRLPLGRHGEDPMRVFADARARIFSWLDAQTRLHAQTPFTDIAGEFTKGHTFIAKVGDVRVEIVEDHARRERPPFALRATTPDPADLAVRRLTSVALLISKNVVEFDISLSVTRDVRYNPARTEHQVPDLLLAMLDGTTVTDAGFQLDGAPMCVRDADDVAMFRWLILAPDRRLPVVAGSEPYLVDYPALARRLRGVAHVAIISSAMTFELSDSIGREWSLWNGAIRTYRAPFQPTTAERHEHPIILGRVVESYAGGEGGAAYAPVLVGRAFQAAIDAADAQPRFSLDEARRLIAVRPRLPAATQEAKAVASVAEREAIPFPIVTVDPADVGTTGEAEHSVTFASLPTEPEHAYDSMEALRGEVEQAMADLARSAEREAALLAENTRLHGLVQQQENDYLGLVADFDALKARKSLEDRGVPGDMVRMHAVPPALRPVVDAVALLTDTLQDAIAGVAAAEADHASALRWMLPVEDGRNGGRPATMGEDAYPDSLRPEIVAAWVEERLAGRLLLHKDAWESLHDSVYERPGDVYAALDLLGQEYRDMRLRTSDSEKERLAFEERLRALHLRISASAAEKTLSRFSRHYTVQDRGCDRVLDLHLRSGGSTSDPRRCLRVYFAWDPDRRVVLVGSLPGHLPNTLS